MTGFAEWNAPDGKSLLTATNGDGVYRSKDGGTTWSPLYRELCNSVTFSMTMSGGEIFARTNGDGIYRYRKPDEWDPIASSWDPRATRIFGLVHAMDNQAGSILAGTTNGLFASVDAGRSWQNA